MTWPPIDRRDVCLVAGAGCLLYGIGSVFQPAAWITAGAVLLAIWALPYVLSRRNS